MKLRFVPSLLLAIVLFFTLAVSIDATPLNQDPQDALVRQVLTAVIGELGWNAHVAGDVSDPGVSEWYTEDDGYDGTGEIGVYAYNTANVAQDNFPNMIRSIIGDLSSAQQFMFHGHPAVLKVDESERRDGTIEHYAVAWLQVGQFTIYITSKLGKDGAMGTLEAFYRNAVKYGLIASGAGTATPIIAGTAAPEVTTTPETGTRIVLNAYAKNYDQVTEVLDNSANFGSVSISGRVTDLNTGAAIGGATIEIASGATSGSTLIRRELLAYGCCAKRSGQRRDRRS